MSLASLSAVEAAEEVRSGRSSAEELARACLDRIAEAEERVQAWAFLDPEHALAQARAADEARRRGEALGPLHGVPVGVKDVFDTEDMPTEDGTVLHAGRRPLRDSTVVRLLRAAGAVILGKTVTTELAVYAPGKTRNPHDPGRTPGGSSSGSAAAVAAGMVPLAVGSQTNGSVIRPASFCGVVGFKPSHGLISRAGALKQSRPLDHVGIFARTVADAALIAEVLAVHDPEDPDTRPRARPGLRRVAAEEPPLPPRLAFVKGPVWDQAEPDARAAFAELAGFLGGHAAEVELPAVFAEAIGQHRIIMESDLAVSFAPEYERGRDRLSARLRGMIEDGRRHLAGDYIRAVARIPIFNRLLDEVFAEYDAILTPATAGEAPKGLESTGSPVFCTIWTLCGTPAVSVPVLQGGSGMPIGAQLVGARGNDARLLRTARWLMEAVAKGRKPAPARRRRAGR
ncbi:MAG: amidase [Proteobacteria bacterium]|nr:amidase [Pseudomonadota bacterium]